MQAQRAVVRFLMAYQETWHRFFPDLHRRGQWHLVSHLCGRGPAGVPVGELAGRVKQVFLLDDATVRERLAELYRVGFCTVEPPDRPVSARTLVVPTPLLTAKFDAHLIDAAVHLLAAGRAVNASLRGAVPAQIDAETRRRLLHAVEFCDEAWLAALEQVFEAIKLSTARRLEGRRNLLSPSHRMLMLMALSHWYQGTGETETEGILADDMAAELLRLLRQNFQTTRDHLGYLLQLGLLDRRSGRALRVAVAPAVAVEMDRALGRSGMELVRMATPFARAEEDVEQTAITHATRPPAAPTVGEVAHHLRVSHPEHAERVVVLDVVPLVVGRAPTSGLVLLATEVSRAHCQIVLANGAVTVTDLESTNGTFVNGERINRVTDLSPGAIVQVGPYQLTYAQMPATNVEGTMRTAAETAAQQAGAA